MIISTPQIITDFTNETGIKAEYHTYTSVLEQENLFNKDAPPDIIMVYHFMLPKLIASNKVQKLSNRKNLNLDLLLKIKNL